MYLWCLDQVMPTTPGMKFNISFFHCFIGILWRRKGSKFHKSVMGPSTSLGAVQWLDYKAQEIPHLQMHSSYFRGEACIMGFEVDGYATDGQNHYIFEFLGCDIHVSFM